MGPCAPAPSRNTGIRGGNGPGIVTTFRPAVSSYNAPRETAEDGLGRFVTTYRRTEGSYNALPVSAYYSSVSRGGPAWKGPS